MKTNLTARLVLVLVALMTSAPSPGQDLHTTDALAQAVQAVLRSNDLTSIESCLVDPENTTAFSQAMRALLKGTDRTTVTVYAVPSGDQSATARAAEDYARTGGEFKSMEARLQKERDDASFNKLFGHPTYPVAPLGDLVVVTPKLTFTLFYGKSGDKYLITQPVRRKARAE